MIDVGLTLGEKLADLINQRGETQKQVAENTGLSPSLISDIINGKKRQGPSVSTLETLCRYFGTSADYLLGLSNLNDEENLCAAQKYTGFSAFLLSDLNQLPKQDRLILIKLLSDSRFRNLLHIITQAARLSEEHDRNEYEIAQAAESGDEYTCSLIDEMESRYYHPFPYCEAAELLIENAKTFLGKIVEDIVMYRK